MRFKDMPYRRITYEEIEKRYQELLAQLQEVSNEEECLTVMKKRYILEDDMTAMELCYVRHDMDLNDPFYAVEQDYYDEIGPKIYDWSGRIDRAMTESPFQNCFEKRMGSFAFEQIRLGLKAHDSRLIPFEQEENVLMNRYSCITANAKVNYDGKQVSRLSLSPTLESSDRGVRRLVSEAIAVSWEEQRDELEEIFDSLVLNRDKQAKILGYDNYVGLSYARMCRIGYSAEDVKRFREIVKKHVVPVAATLFEQRKKRLGLEHLYGYDAGISFLNGNPIPIGDEKFCLEMTGKMYRKLSPETAEFIDFMMDNGLYDVALREGKRGGGYCTQFAAYHAPFIFANFDGTSENAYVMCHEGGHAFYYYLKRNEEIRERSWMTSEAAETHAMAMEFFLTPYMELFFGDRAEDYRRMHLEKAISLIVYECQQDEFQQLIYEQPSLGKNERNEIWERLEREYFPYREYTKEESERVGYHWQRIMHAYQYPFYAVDYALAQMCALEYYRWMKEDFDGAWKSYLTFCDKTGHLNFPETIKAAGLGDPFSEENLQNLMGWLQMQLNA